MAADIISDKLSIKNLLFTKAIPNYVIPIPTNGYKVFGCTDCGDRFTLESSYLYHINRKSVKITYMCRYCGQEKIFYNRCKLLFHIRSHVFKTASINVTDLKVEPLPLCFYGSVTPSITNNSTSIPANHTALCSECLKDITDSGVLLKDRIKHFMQHTGGLHVCPVCMFTLPTLCALRAHIRIHTKKPPYICSECGVNLSNKAITYPYTHDCDGFKMMRVASRIKCFSTNCHNVFHPNHYKEHMKENHVKKVYKCPVCVVACFNESTMEKHLKSHQSHSKALIFFQCGMCPGRLVLRNHIENHLKSHKQIEAYPCWTCGTVFQHVLSLLDHHVSDHNLSPDVFNNIINPNEVVKDNNLESSTRSFRVVKRCDQCLRSFTYRCKSDDIGILPTECPYKCIPNAVSNDTLTDVNISENLPHIICHMCKQKVSKNWDDIKKHYAEYHKNYTCLDIEILLEKIDVNKVIKSQRKATRNKARVAFKKSPRKTNKRQRPRKFYLSPKNQADAPATLQNTENIDQGKYTCKKCGHINTTKEQLEEHLKNHRDPCMAYQCLECGQSFVVKPSFSTHLLLEHGISDSEDYINKKQCFNETALSKHHYDFGNNEELLENQCKICRDNFDSPEDLVKHFRVHGMAFLMKNTTNKNSS